MKSALKLTYYPLLTKIAIKKLERKQKFDSLEELVDFAFNFYCGINVRGLKLTIKPSQIKEEIHQLLKILSNLQPKNLLEIGTANGGTLFLFCQIAHPKAKIISIDLPGGKFGGGYPLWKVPLYKSFAKKKQKIYLLRADSHKPSTFQKVKSILGNEKLDFLFIDGDHTYEGVKKDFEMYSKLVERERIIALHDIVYHPHVPECQVHKFWEKIKRKYKTKEIISSPTQTWAGIGLVFT